MEILWRRTLRKTTTVTGNWQARRGERPARNRFHCRRCRCCTRRKWPQLTPHSRREWRRNQKNIRPLIVVSCRSQTPRAFRHRASFLTPIIPLSRPRQPQPQMTIAERGMKIFIAKTPITRQLPLPHMKYLLPCPQHLHLHCLALHAPPTPPPPMFPLPTPSVETAHLPTFPISQILPAVVTHRAPHMPL